MASAMASRIFLLSPANCSGQRARMLLSPRADFELAVRLRAGEATLGEAFSFLSGLYFRGKLAYARAFANPPDPAASLTGGGSLVITTNSGLRSPDTPVTLRALQAFARGDISVDSRSYTTALTRSARTVLDEVGDGCEVILLGSIATPKYVDVLLSVFDGRLCFPADFVGRGDMSRGGLMLRRARSGEELRYIPVKGAVRHGARPPKLAPISRVSS
ncbi:MAG: hypothetical protein ACM36C_01340 [Acidobacteriota bacterium]